MKEANTNPFDNSNDAGDSPTPPRQTTSSLKGAPLECVMLQAGFVTFTGYVFNQVDADAYNRFTREIEAERYEPTKAFLRDQRHRYFVLLCNRAPGAV